jgi:hypothetical protein
MASASKATQPSHNRTGSSSMGPPSSVAFSIKEQPGSLSPSVSQNGNSGDGQKGRALSCSECKRRKIKVSTRR